MDTGYTPDTRPEWMKNLADAIEQRHISLSDVAAGLEAKGHRLKYSLNEMLLDESRMGKTALYALIEAVSPLNKWKQREADNPLFIRDALKWAAEQEKDAAVRPAKKGKAEKPPEPMRPRRGVRAVTLPPPMRAPAPGANAFQAVIEKFHNQEFARGALHPLMHRTNGRSVDIARAVELLLTYAKPIEDMRSEDLLQELQDLYRGRKSLAFAHINHAETDYGLKREAFLSIFPEGEMRQHATRILGTYGLRAKQVDGDRWQNNDHTREALARLKPDWCIEAEASRFSAALTDLLDAAQDYQRQKRHGQGHAR